MGESMELWKRKWPLPLPQSVPTCKGTGSIPAEALAAAMAPPEPPKIELNHWGLSGRQSMMQMRNMMQLKAFRSLPDRVYRLTT
jgi:hypothetical protein